MNKTKASWVGLFAFLFLVIVPVLGLIYAEDFASKLLIGLFLVFSFLALILTIKSIMKERKEKKRTPEHAKPEEEQKPDPDADRIKRDLLLEDLRRSCEEKKKKYQELKATPPVYPVIAFGHTSNGAPILWYILDQDSDQTLLLSKCSLAVSSDNELFTALNDLYRFFSPEERAALNTDPSDNVPFFLLSLSQVEQYLAGHCEILCQPTPDNEGSKQNKADAINSLFSSENFAWYLSECFDKNNPAHAAWHISCCRADSNHPNYGDRFPTMHFCIDEAGTVARPTSYCYWDNVSGGGWYPFYYGIRPACRIDSAFLEVAKDA